MATDPTLTRRRYLVRGVVQGVGFRPHVAQVAARHAVTGFVGNDDAQVFCEVQGADEVLDVFWADLLATLPPLARVLDSDRQEADVIAEDGFRVVASRRTPGRRTLIPPDVATCADCLRELRDAADRRHGYAFITCTNCGPRLSIITDLPYDRPATTMCDFVLCPACAAEYDDISDRRHHAQPISCYDCGPRLWLAEPGDSGEPPAPGPTSAVEHAAVIAEARRRLHDGQILAVKGIGGFHLMCDATNGDTVLRLRQRKRRSGKPFAVMVADVAAARRLAQLTPDQEAVLASSARPIVIAPMAHGARLADQVAPGLSDVGVLLPYTPLHHLLLDDHLTLVATSANLSEEPLCYTNESAMTAMAGLADGFVLHNRDIHVPVEDSVCVTSADGHTVPVRRSRGYAPIPFRLPHRDGPSPTILAVGGELKNTATLLVADNALVSTHVGDMGSLAAQRAFAASVQQLTRLHRAEPELVVCDLHPNYATTAWAQRYVDANGLRLVGVQHHVAHACSLLAEHQVDDRPVVVAAVDGTGYGTDATIWGGEVLTIYPSGGPWTWTRTWHIPTFSLVGGDRAIRYPWRIAHGLAHSWGLNIADTPATTTAPPAEAALVASQLEGGVAVVPTSSVGRLFDAAAALLGLCTEATFEAHAAMACEAAASQWLGPVGTVPGSVAELMADLIASTNRPVSERAWRLHAHLAAILAARLTEAAALVDTDVVGLTGGSCVNRILTEQLTAALTSQGLRVLSHRQIPPTDGGLSLGQAWAGRLELSEVSKSAAADPPPTCRPSESHRTR